GLCLAAVLALGPGAALSHRAAAAHHGLRPSSSRQVEVTAPSRNGRARRRGITIHHGALHAWEYAIHDGIPTATVARTLLDLAETLAPDALRRAIDVSLEQQLFDLTPVEPLIPTASARRGCEGHWPPRRPRRTRDSRPPSSTSCVREAFRCQR
ncbi:MAG: hypothetical protein ACR2HC_00210, partial [Thermoleophilaceae bacterium]